MPTSISDDIKYMQLCLELAEKALGLTAPNPMVGAVIVKDSKIISKGYHHKSGEAHAEANAFANAKDQSVEGATLYCNLEPCCHLNKRTPPCAQQIIKKKISRVVIANLDPNPDVNSKGVELLRDAGIEVITGVLEQEGEYLNRVFFKNMREKKAFIHMKIASTLDGNLAMNDGRSKWITSEEMRLYTHQERFSYDAIGVGSKTYELDNPSLTIRHPELPAKNLKRFVFSSNPLKLKEDFELIDHRQEQLAQRLYEKSIGSIYIEAGQKLATFLLNQRLIDQVSFCFAPKILGDQKRLFGELVDVSLDTPITFKDIKWQQIGDDMLFSALLNK